MERGRRRSKHRRLLQSIRFVECALLDYRGILFNHPIPSRLESSALKGYSRRYLDCHGMYGVLKERT